MIGIAAALILSYPGVLSGIMSCRGVVRKVDFGKDVYACDSGIWGEGNLSIEEFFSMHHPNEKILSTAYDEKSNTFYMMYK